MKEYETIFIVNPNAPQSDLQKFNEKITKLIEQHNGTVILEKNLGKRALAYEVKKHNKGNYMLFDYTGDSHVVADIERSLRLDEMILKFLTVRLADEVDVEARKKQLADAELNRPAEGAAEAPKEGGDVKEPVAPVAVAVAEEVENA